MAQDHCRNRRRQEEKEYAADQAADGLAARFRAAGRHSSVNAGRRSGRDQVSAAEGTGLRIIFDCLGTVRTGLHRGPPSAGLLKRDKPQAPKTIKEERDYVQSTIGCFPKGL